jgi:hypothetical protein
MVDTGNRSLGDAIAGDGHSVHLWVYPTTALQDVVFEYSRRPR